MQPARSRLWTIYYLTPPTYFGRLQHLQGYLIQKNTFNPVFIFLSISFIVNKMRSSLEDLLVVLMVCLEMAAKGETFGQN